MAVRRDLGVVDRHEVLHLADAVLGEEARDEDVASPGSRAAWRPSPRRRAQRVEAALVLVEDRAEHARRVERRAAVPVDRAVGADERDRVQVADEAVLGDREVVRLELPRRGHAPSSPPPRGRRPSPRRARRPARRGGRAGSSCGGRGRAPCTPPPRARAGSSSRSPAVETPPPMTISCGSNRLIALAIPMPSRWPRTSSTRSASASPALAPSTTSWPVTSPSCSSRLPRNESSSSRASRSASRSSARPAARYSSVPGSGCLPSGVGRAVLEVEPDHGVADLAGARRAAVEAAVEDQAAADAGADGEHHEVRARRGCRSSSNASASAAHDASFSM